MVVTYNNLSESLVIELYLQYGIKPAGINIVPKEDTNDKLTRLNRTYKIEPCRLDDGSCKLY